MTERMLIIDDEEVLEFPEFSPLNLYKLLK